MRAMAFARTGGIEVLEPLDLPVPPIATDDVLIRVSACGLNHLDLWVRQGLPQSLRFPHVGGCEAVGRVADIGSGVHGLEIGQSVLVAPGQGCGRCAACARGDDPACREYIIPGEHAPGGFAEFTRAPARHVIPLSDAWSLDQWAATPLTFLTAFSMVHRHGRVAPGDDVLVQAGASGVGSAAIQIAKLAGARVFTTVSTDLKARLARELGADVVVNSQHENFAEVVKDQTQGRGVDLVIEHVGQAVWKDSLKCLAHGGRLVTCGATTGPQVALDLRFFFIREIEVIGAFMGRRGELLQVLKLLDRKLLRPVVDRTFPLAELARAQQYLESRQQLGKVVVVVE